MNTPQLIFFLLSSAGLTIIVTKSLILKPIRDTFMPSAEIVGSLKMGWKPTGIHRIKAIILKWITCPLCLGMWAGVGVHYLLKTESGIVLCYGFSASLFSWVTWKLVGEGKTLQ